MSFDFVAVTPHLALQGVQLLRCLNVAVMLAGRCFLSLPFFEIQCTTMQVLQSL